MAFDFARSARYAQDERKQIPKTVRPERSEAKSKDAIRQEIGSRGGTRTPDKVVNSHLLYRLSYPGTTGLTWHTEPSTRPPQFPGAANPRRFNSAIMSCWWVAGQKIRRQPGQTEKNSWFSKT